MSLKNSMNILLEDMKKQDAVIEADIKQYATLCETKKQHDEAAARRREEQNALKTMFSTIGGNLAVDADSVHINVLENKIASEQQSSLVTDKQITARANYYRGLEKEDISALWELGDEQGALAAIYYTYAKNESVTALDLYDSCYQQIFNSKEKIQTPVVMRYLLEKTLIKSDVESDSDREQEKLDEKLRLVFEQIQKEAEEPVWNYIAMSLRIRETQRISRSCEVIIRELDEWQKNYNETDAGYQRIVNMIKDGLNTQKDDNLGREVTECIQQAKRWYANSTKQLEELRSKCKTQAEKVPTEKSYLERCKESLVFEEATGLEHNKALELMQSVEQRRERFVEFDGLQRMEDALSETQKEYKIHLEEIGQIKNQKRSEIEEATRVAATKRAEKKRKIEEFKKKWIDRLYVAGAVLIFLLGGVAFGWQDDWDVEGLLGFLPAPSTADYVYVADTASPYFVSLGRLVQLSISEGTDVKTVWVPFANKDKFSVFYSNLDGEEVFIPKNAYRLGVRSCNNIKVLDVPENIKELKVADCHRLEQINTEERATLVKKIENCSSYQE